MSLISYPRTKGKDPYQRKLRNILKKIDNFLSNTFFSLSDLNTILDLIELIGWENLPPNLKYHLLKVLRQKLQPKVFSSNLDNAYETTNKLNVTTLEIALSFTKNQESLSIKDRLNKTDLFDFKSIVSTKEVNILRSSDDLIIIEQQSSNETKFGDALSTSSLFNETINHLENNLQRKIAKSFLENKGVSLYNNATVNYRYQLNNIEDPHVRQLLFDKHNIKIGTYKELKKIKKNGYQREHFIPHSCFMSRSANTTEIRGKIPINSAFGGYTELNAITYFVYDGQSIGTEHRYLTDQAKRYANFLDVLGEYATVKDWLDRIETETSLSLSMDTIQRAEGIYETRVPAEEAQLVAKAIRFEVQCKLEAVGCNLDANCSNIIGGGTASEKLNVDTIEELLS